MMRRHVHVARFVRRRRLLVAAGATSARATRRGTVPFASAAAAPAVGSSEITWSVSNVLYPYVRSNNLLTTRALSSCR